MSLKRIKNYHVNTSESFMIRTRCKFCLQFPDLYFRFNNEKLYKSPDFKRKINSKFTFSKFRYDDYLLESPKDFKTISHLNYDHYIKSYNCKIHRVYGTKKYNITECLVCPCGKSIWNFRNNYLSTRKEISNRKSRILYPKKFDF